VQQHVPNSLRNIEETSTPSSSWILPQRYFSVPSAMRSHNRRRVGRMALASLIETGLCTAESAGSSHDVALACQHETKHHPSAFSDCKPTKTIQRARCASVSTSDSGSTRTVASSKWSQDRVKRNWTNHDCRALVQIRTCAARTAHPVSMVKSNNCTSALTRKILSGYQPDRCQTIAVSCKTTKLNFTFSSILYL
jgi:hypothetical protein